MMSILIEGFALVNASASCLFRQDPSALQSPDIHSCRLVSELVAELVAELPPQPANAATVVSAANAAAAIRNFRLMALPFTLCVNGAVSRSFVPSCTCLLAVDPRLGHDLHL